ncbi:hypothetical protein AMJ85_10030 [candidate division BRC1 bacterium SM23_51]|nr:MAG: hypothetical protein AMJ85_10030 [candidate division BRC1 bacterium SM23_51]
MGLLRVVIYGDDRLHTQCEPVEQMTPDLCRLIADMAETMYTASGVGLSAPQVGVLERLLVLDVDQVDEEGAEKQTKELRRQLRVFINPEVLWTSDEDEPFVEGCLSIPGVEAEIYRPSRARVRYRDQEWNEREEEVDGLLARVLQHEIDHLNGILFVDRMGFVKRQRVARQLRRLREERETICVPAEIGAQ